MQLPSVQAATRLWYAAGQLIAFAFVDDYNNLRFEIRDEAVSAPLQTEIVDWGVTVMGARQALTGRIATLDAAVPAGNGWQIAMLERHGFARLDFRSLRYARALDIPIQPQPLPAGFTLRPVTGEPEVEALVALHRAAFGTDNMTVEARLAMMRVPGYMPELDLLVVAPNGSLAAFCVCGVEDAAGQVGYTDPIGTHPDFQRRGLASAVVTAGLQALQARGVTAAELGTSSQNLAMQQLASHLGFRLVAEKLWFSKPLPA
ncbi:MAG: GNAT family N-acetyltransferase [Ardenticatenales bacterium]|nr:GNAT family N-acetyltransferase [Ardenticatenales bacterium]